MIQAEGSGIIAPNNTPPVDMSENLVYVDK